MHTLYTLLGNIGTNTHCGYHGPEKKKKITLFLFIFVLFLFLFPFLFI